MKVGLIGLGLSGKTTIFNALTQGEIEVGGYQSRRGEVHLGRVLVRDDRVDWLAELDNARKTTYAEIEYLDVAGFSGERQRNIEEEIPAALRECDALAHVVRAFADPNSEHPKGSVDIRRDVRLLEEQLVFSDLLTVENRLNKVGRQAKLVKDDKVRAEYDLLRRIREFLETNRPLRQVQFDDNDAKLIRGFHFLSNKPVLIVISVDESQISEMDEIRQEYSDLAVERYVGLIPIAGKLQAELAQLDEADRQEFLTDLGLKGTAVDRMIRKSYDLLGLISFLTTSEKESRAWPIPEGSTALEAAGVIHKDFQRGFIRAEVVAFDDLKACGDMPTARKRGLVRSEGKTYKVNDGDVIYFLFNV
jgi:hypothetical protein